MENLNKKSSQETRKFEKVYAILNSYSYDHNKLIQILHDIQKEYKYLSEEVLVLVANLLKISPARVFGIVTFYAYFALKPKGKYIIRVCNSTTCHLKNSTLITKTICDKLKITENNPTTHDMLFTLEIVPCLGACAVSPIMIINEVIYPAMTPEKVELEIDKIYNEEKINDHIS